MDTQINIVINTFFIYIEINMHTPVTPCSESWAAAARRFARGLAMMRSAFAEDGRGLIERMGNKMGTRFYVAHERFIRHTVEGVVGATAGAEVGAAGAGAGAESASPPKSAVDALSMALTY